MMSVKRKGAEGGARGAGERAHAPAFAAALALLLLALQAGAAQAKKPDLPYAAIDHPQFVPAAQARFLHPNDLLIGVSHGKIAKAYPAAILAQHGVVQDQMPDGPIAATW